MEFPYKTIIEFSLASMPCSSRRKPFGKFKDFPIHKFVELVETNPDVTPAFGLPRGFARFDVSTSSTHRKLNGLVPEPVEGCRKVEGFRNGRRTRFSAIL